MILQINKSWMGWDSNSQPSRYSQTRLKRTARDRTFLFVITGVRYNRVNLCTYMTNFALKSVRYNRVFVITEFVITEFHCTLFASQF
jgi:hypothetical protein